MREFPSSHEILKVFEQNPHKTFRLRELVEELGLRSSQARELKSALKELARRRKIRYLKKSHFVIEERDSGLGTRGWQKDRDESLVFESRVPSPESRLAARRNAVAGRLIGHRDGYGFVVPEKPIAGTDRDIFIPANGLGSAMHGDRVEVHVIRSKPDGRLEGRVTRVVDRAQKTVVGEFHAGGRESFVVPFETRIAHEIVIPRGEEWPPDAGAARRNRQFGGPPPEGIGAPRPLNSKKGFGPQGGESEGRRKRGSEIHRSAIELDGLIVDVEITSFPAPGQAPRGRVTEILGRRDEFGVDVEIIIRKYHLPHRFPAEVLEEAEATPQYVSELMRAARRDFRALPIVTIDGETAKDFDDAVYVERVKAGESGSASEELRRGGFRTAALFPTPDSQLPAPLHNGYRLHVHIADVAHYVRPSMALDREARLRGTSVYFPDRAVPMLPLELSNGICSLNPHVERLVMSALLSIDAAGNVTEYELVPGVIRSAERMTYTAVEAILSGDTATCLRYSSLVENFRLMEELARLLNARRLSRGSIDFDLPEAEIEFDELGRMVGVARAERNRAHRIIEEFMLVANEAVARYLEGRGIPALYRIHEKPDPKKVLEFEEIAASFGYSLGIEMPAARRVRVRRRDERERYPRFAERVDPAELHITSRHYQRLTERIAGKPEERILSYLMLRSLKQARYAEENVGHFALASPTYTHFTSPIRRYPDLVVHRILKAALEGSRELGVGNRENDRGSGFGARDSQNDSEVSSFCERRTPNPEPRSLLCESRTPNPESRSSLSALGLETSEAERRAADAERELMEWKKVSFMAGRLGDEFDALIISLTKYGFFVELTDLFVEGFVPLETLGDGRYVYRESLRAIVGPRSERGFRLGERIKVRLDRIDPDGNRLEFAVVG